MKQALHGQIQLKKCNVIVNPIAFTAIFDLTKRGFREKHASSVMKNNNLLNL